MRVGPNPPHKDCCPYKKRVGDRHPRKEHHVKMKEMAIYKPRRGLRNQPTNTLFLDFRPSFFQL